jgi:hypothetical protein
MDAIRNNYSGTIHIALSGVDETLCGVRNIEKRTRGSDVLNDAAQFATYEELIIGKSVERVLAAVTCKRCRAYAIKHYLGRRHQ